MLKATLSALPGLSRPPGHPNYLFRYDAHRRLSDYIGVYDDGLHFEFRHRYGYDSKNRIVQ